VGAAGFESADAPLVRLVEQVAGRPRVFADSMYRRAIVCRRAAAVRGRLMSEMDVNKKGSRVIADADILQAPWGGQGRA
jgi:hypothetical protein